jgi:hypothetical protein
MDRTLDRRKHLEGSWREQPETQVPMTVGTFVERPVDKAVEFLRVWMPPVSMLQQAPRDGMTAATAEVCTRKPDLVCVSSVNVKFELPVAKTTHFSHRWQSGPLEPLAHCHEGN